MAEIKDIKIRDEFITLGQLLKIVDLISAGGETKYFLANNKIFVNGEEENRRGKKLYKGYEIKVLGKTYKIC